MFVGGVAARATADKIVKLSALLDTVSRFIDDVLLPDAYCIADGYPEYFSMGGGYGRLLSYGCFDRYPALGTLYVDPLVFDGETIQPFDPRRISEHTERSFFREEGDRHPSIEDLPQEDIHKENAYTWIKAARYDGLPYEVGPLARQWLSGAYRRGISAMDRIIARALEAKTIASILRTLLQNLEPGVRTLRAEAVPASAEGAGLIDTTRGALGHWTLIRDGVIAGYQIITPSMWNLSPKAGMLFGTAEEALIGSPVSDTDAPVEIGRILRSFDPCVSCATHVFLDGAHVRTVQVL